MADKAFGAEQMKRDGIKRLRAWSNPVRAGCASISVAVQRPHCEHIPCGKIAGYSTPRGNRCFAHAISDNAS